MKKVYTNENRLIVFNMKNVLQDAGIQSVVENEFSSGGVGDLSPFETWPELWVVQDRDEARARQVLQQVIDASGDDWFCPKCGERNPASFQICWNCGAARPAN